MKNIRSCSLKNRRKNYGNYFSLACAGWQLDKIKEAEELFLNIINSTLPVYNGTCWRSSDIPGDTTKNSYGYGSYSSNYKNYAARYLTKIYLEKKEYQKALEYIVFADKKYQIHFTCGTGYRFYQDEINGLYSLCYEGLNRYEDVKDLYLGDFEDGYNPSLLKAMNKLYTQKEIDSSLQAAENSIVFKVDSNALEVYKVVWGNASIVLFGRKIEMRYIEFKEGEVYSRERYVRYFKESWLYTSLKEEYTDEE